MYAKTCIVVLGLIRTLADRLKVKLREKPLVTDQEITETYNNLKRWCEDHKEILDRIGEQRQ